MKKLYAVICVVGFTAFWTYGFMVLSGVLGERTVEPWNFVLCLLGLGAGLATWGRVLQHAPRVHGRRAAARVRLEEEYRASLETAAPRGEERATSP